jgi:divalent metal cation (Fe/Co/Zn/Cd) transporter
MSHTHMRDDTPGVIGETADGPFSASLTVERRAQLGQRARLLAGASVAYNAVEAVIAIAAGAAASSIALVGFGLDSIVEMSSGLVILWQFGHHLPESRERQALRLIAVSFFALAGYVSFESVRALLSGRDAGHSTVGIVLAASSLLVMPFLSWAQRRTGRALSSGSVVADSKQTLLCTYLSAVLLLGLLANTTLGWSWLDPLVGLVIAGVAVKEGAEAWRGDACCDVPAAAAPHTTADAVSDAAAGCADGCCASAATSDDELTDRVHPTRA